MQYFVIATKQGKTVSVSEPMHFEDARAKFADITGEDVTGVVEGEELMVGPTTLRQATLPELVYTDESGAKVVDRIIDTFSDERMETAFTRTLKEFGDLVPTEPEGDYADGFREELNKQLSTLAASDLVAFLKSSGMVEAVGVREDGKTVYASVDPDIDILELV